MSSLDIDRIRASLTAGRHPDQLADRVVRSLGSKPRRIPSRTVLAIESLATNAVLAAVLLGGIALGAGLAARDRTEPSASIVASAIAGRTAPASEVFAAMTGLDTHSEGGQ
jgi:hypothetical protein